MPEQSSVERARAYGIAGLVSVTVFAAVCTGAQFWRADLDWLAAPLSYYLTGPGGWAVAIAYLALATGLVAIGRGFGVALAPFARMTAAKLLFHVAGIGLAVTALTEVAKSWGYHAEWTMLHLIAAQTTFLSVTVAMLLQSWRLRVDPHWRSAFGFAFILAIAAFTALCGYLIDRSLPRGLAQKGVIALILAWLSWASFNLYQSRRTPLARAGSTPTRC
jgi:hypothetical protein